MTRRLVEIGSAAVAAAGENFLRFLKQTVAPTAITDEVLLYFLPGTTVGTVRLMLKAGTGPEITVLDDIRQDAGTLIELLKVARALLADGTATAPGYSFASDTAAGIWRRGSKDIGVADVVKTKGDGTASLPAYSFDSDPDLGMYRIGADEVGFAGSMAFRGPRPWVDVRAYGLTSAGAQAAVDKLPSSGGEVRFSPGVYDFTSAVALKKDVVLVGMGASSIIQHNAGTSPLFTLSGAGLAPARIGFRNLRFLGGTGTGDAIQLNGTAVNQIAQVQLVNVYFDQLLGASSYALKCTEALEVMIDRCAIAGQRGNGILITDTSNACVIRDCVLSNGGFGATAIEVRSIPGAGTDGVLIEGNVIEAWRGSFGVVIDTVGVARIIGNHFEDNDGSMLWVGANVAGGFSHSVNIIGNHFSPNVQTTSDISIAALDGYILGNDLRGTTILNQAGGGNQANYCLLANHVVAGMVLTDNTAAIDVIFQAGNRGGAGLANGVKVKGNLGFFNVTPAIQQSSGANLTNNMTAGGVNDTIANYTDLVTYTNDAAAIRNDIYQLARKLKQVNDALRVYGLLT